VYDEKGIKRGTRKYYSSEEKIRIVLEGLCGEDSIAQLCRREGISEVYYNTTPDERPAILIDLIRHARVNRRVKGNQIAA
jgi:hypothetical protein